MHSSIYRMAIVAFYPLFCFCEQDVDKEVAFFHQKQNAARKTVCLVESDSRLQIGADYTYVHLKPHGHSSFHGHLGGVQALYEYRPLSRFYEGVKFAWKEGKTDGLAGKRSLLYFDVQERLGYTFATERKEWLVTLFSGFGYRYTGQKLHSSKGASVHFNYNEFYFPVGILAHYDINSWTAIGVDVTWMPQVYPTVSIVPLKGARWNLTNQVANYYVSIPLTFSFTKNKKFQIIFNPFYEHWQNGHTTAKLTNGIALGLPGNTYNFYGADLNFGYSF